MINHKQNAFTRIEISQSIRYSRYLSGFCFVLNEFNYGHRVAAILFKLRLTNIDKPKKNNNKILTAGIIDIISHLQLQLHIMQFAS